MVPAPTIVGAHMPTSHRRFRSWPTLVLWLAGASLLAQEPRAPQSQSAATLLRLALDAAGGHGTIAALTAVRFRDNGEGATHDQSPTPEPPFVTTTVSELVTVDPNGERLQRQERGPTYEQTFRVDGHEGWVSNGSLTTRIAPGQALDTQRRVTRRIPALLLLEAETRAETARVTGTANHDGRAHDVVAVTLADGLALQLWIDQQTRLLTRHVRPYVDASLGDTTEDTVFDGYHRVGGVLMPSSYTVRRGPYIIRRSTLSEIAVNPSLSPDTYRPQGDVGQVPADGRRPYHEVQRIAPRVYLLEQVSGHNFNVMFIDQDDGVVVIDAPETRPYRGLNERVIATIRRTLPGRPIRYIVPTHHHTDHGGGLRAYIAEGIPVVTTAANEAFVRRSAAASFRLRPDALALRPRTPIIDVMTGRRRTIESGGHVIELHDIGPEYHAQQNLAVWLPAERILFLTDIFETGYRTNPRWDGGGELGRILAGRPWNIEIYATSHSGPRRMADLRRPAER